MKLLSKIIIATAFFLVGVGVGFFACFYTNGYERSLFAIDATNTDIGARVLASLRKHKNTLNTQPLTAVDVFGYVPQKICLQPPYMTASMFRQHLKANLFGLRMANDTENLLWIVDASSIAQYVAINRLAIVDIVGSKDGARCINGDRVIFQPGYSQQQFLMNFEEKK